VKGFSRKQRKRVDAAFHSFAGADILIDFGEWKHTLGMRNDFLAQRIFDVVDTDGTGFIDRDEFLAFAAQLYSEDRRKRLELIFRIYDLDGDGAIDRKEIRKILEESLKEQSVAVEDEVLKTLTTHFFKKTDIDEDKRISLDDFTQVIGAYPRIDEQFSIYAASWLNEGRGFRAPPWRAASLLLRLRTAWESRRAAFLWGLSYATANAVAFILAAQSYAEGGASYLIQLARGAGACLNLNGALVLVPMCRSFWTWVRGTRLAHLFPLDSTTEAHRAIGWAIAGFSALHIGAHVASIWEDTGAVLLLMLSPVGLTGVGIAVALAIMMRYAVSPKAQKHESFASSHALYAAVLAGLLLHAPGFWQWFAAPFALFLLDCLARWTWKTRRIEILELKPLPDGVTYVRFRKPRRFAFRPGDYLRLQIPRLSRLQWHPFTISAAPEATMLGVHVRNEGDWTGALHNLSRNKSLEGRKWPARIDGPYGAPSSGIDRANVAVLVAAGIGITPFASTLQSVLLRDKGARGKPPPVIYFHWLNRSQRSYEWFVDLLAQAERVLGAERFRLSIHLTSLTHDLTNIAMQVAMDSYSERYRKDPLTGLNAVTSAGRPDWDTVFKGISLAHPREPVDVYFCGPPALGTALREQCWKYGFFYHEEKF
jgi:NAD(P)H-flavin reductase/Ca2+-binding EF-hand superfamily protein